jgi:hypothetical protein
MLKAEERCGPDDECGPKHQGELLKRLSEVTDSVTVPITLSDVKKIYGVIKQLDSSSYPDLATNRQVVPHSDGDYKLFDRSCIDFIANVATELGYPVPDRGKLQLPVDFISAFKPLAEAEEKTRAAHREAEMAKEKADAAERQAKESELAKQKAEGEAADAKDQARQADQARQQADQARRQAEQRATDGQKQLSQSIPAGWVPCSCPSFHAQYGKFVNGVLYHPSNINCPR